VHRLYTHTHTHTHTHTQIYRLVFFFFFLINLRRVIALGSNSRFVYILWRRSLGIDLSPVAGIRVVRHRCCSIAGHEIVDVHYGNRRVRLNIHCSRRLHFYYYYYFIVYKCVWIFFFFTCCPLQYRIYYIVVVIIITIVYHYDHQLGGSGHCGEVCTIWNECTRFSIANP
jgi:hypothetical protein